MGLLRIRIRRGINLAIRDTVSSDPYVVITHGDQRVRTSVVKNNCNPEWNEELTISISDPNVPINLTVYDKDTFTVDDKMGEAQIDIKPYMECLEWGLQSLPDGTKVNRVQPNAVNCLSDESCIIWNKGKMTQEMLLRLRNVERGEVQIQIEWIDVKGLNTTRR